MTVIRHDDVAVNAALAALDRITSTMNGADRLAVRVVRQRITDQTAATEGAVDLLSWAFPYVPEPTHDMGSCEYVENYAKALRLAT